MSTINLSELASPPAAPSTGRHTLYADANGFQEIDDTGAITGLRNKDFGKDYQYEATDGNVTSTSDTMVTSVTLVTPALTGEYKLTYSYELKVTSGSPGTVEAQVVNSTDATTLAFTDQNGTDNGEDRGYGGHVDITFAGTSKTFVIQVANNGSAATANIRRSRLSIQKVST